MATTEERLAALEAKLAALTATTPTEYYTHQYSGEEIDAAVGRAVSGGALDTSVTNVSNQLGTFVRPNLLDNWYFGRPVNQRGKTSYTGIGYGIDRWKIDIDTGSGVSINNGLTIKNAGSYIGQYLDRLFDSLDGIPITGSIILSSGHLLTGTLIYKSIINQPQIFFSDSAGGVSMYVNALSNTLTQVELATLKDNVSILAVKLELGPTQTLAHREGDKWVINEVPEYGNQLRRCQRYAIDLHGPTNYGVLGSGVARRTDRASIFCPLPVSMRVTPVATFGGSLTLASDADAGRGYVVTAVNVDHINSNGITLNVDTAGLSISTVYQLWRQGDASAHILLSADL